MIDQMVSKEDLETRVQQLENQIEFLQVELSIMQNEMTIVYDMQAEIARIPKIQQTLNGIRDAFN